MQTRKTRARTWSRTKQAALSRLRMAASQTLVSITTFGGSPAPYLGEDASDGFVGREPGGLLVGVANPAQLLHRIRFGVYPFGLGAGARVVRRTQLPLHASTWRYRSGHLIPLLRHAAWAGSGVLSLRSLRLLLNKPAMDATILRHISQGP